MNSKYKVTSHNKTVRIKSCFVINSLNGKKPMICTDSHTIHWCADINLSINVCIGIQFLLMVCHYKRRVVIDYEEYCRSCFVI